MSRLHAAADPSSERTERATQNHTALAAADRAISARRNSGVSTRSQCLAIVGGRTIKVVRCSCCGEERDDAMVVSLRCDDHVKVCRDCVGWLSERAGGIDVTPTLPVADMDDAVRFCEAAGFDVQRYDDGFAFVHLNGQSVFDLDLISAMDPASNHAGATSSPATSMPGTAACPSQECRSVQSKTNRGVCTSSL